MKKLFCALFLVTAVTGCQTSPVPSTKFTGSLGGQPFEFVGHKQTMAKGVKLFMQHGTNTFELHIDELSSQNDPEVISKAAAGRVAELNAMGGLFQSIGGAAGSFAGQAANKGVKGGL